MVIFSSAFTYVKITPNDPQRQRHVKLQVQIIEEINSLKDETVRGKNI